MNATTSSREGSPTHPGEITVWDLPTRIFHWSLAFSFAGAFITAEADGWRSVHIMLGYTLLGLLVFRLLWGMVGSRYARFSAFVTGPAKTKSYLASLLARQPEHHVGHNPAGALAIIALIGLGLLISLSGLATVNELGGTAWSHSLEELHEGAANVMLAVVFIHIAGVLVSSLLHRENLVGAMLAGNKRGNPESSIGSRHRLVGATLLLAIIGAWAAWGWSNGKEAGGGLQQEQRASAAETEKHGKKHKHRDDD